jgi:arginine/lysine/ornithine decarboxylase
MEVPFRFYPCLTAGLAYYLAMKKAPDRIQILKAVYEEEFERASAEDRDRSNLTLTPSSTYYGFV